MKENVYAWFPPASEILKARHKEVDSYTKECLYRYDKSRFSDKIAENATSSEETVQQLHSKQDGITAMTRGTSLYPHPPSIAPATRSRSVATEAKNRWVSPKDASFSNAVTSKEWHGRLAETSTSVVPNDQNLECSVLLNPPAETKTMRSRVQSAFIQRPAIPIAKRTIQSALPLGRSGPCASQQIEMPGPEMKSRQVTSRPQAPTPYRWVEETDQKEEDSTDYDEQLKTFGWKMEIPGDPLQIKRSCLGKRLPTTVVVPLHSIQRRSNICQTQSCETFFYNTIPRMPLSFTVHPDWASEVLQARRLELKAKQIRPASEAGLGHHGHRRFVRQADFSFVY